MWDGNGSGDWGWDSAGAVAGSAQG